MQYFGWLYKEVTQGIVHTKTNITSSFLERAGIGSPVIIGRQKKKENNESKEYFVCHKSLQIKLRTLISPLVFE